MPLKRRDLAVLLFVIVGLLFLMFLSTTGNNWSVANAQTVPPTITPIPTATSIPRDVPEADTLLLFGGGFGGLATWLGWQWRQARTKKTK